MKPLNTFLSRFSRTVPGVGAERADAAMPIDIAATIDQALASAGLLGRPEAGSVIDVVARSGPARPANRRTVPAFTMGKAAPAARHSTTPTTPAASAASSRGMSLERRFSNAAGARAYTLYIPPGLDPTSSAPLVLMLHGCTQNAADFAAGTRMNALADQFGVRVAYPDQTSRENAGSCWNWFRSEDQRRESGEPSILAGIVADIAADVSVDPKRVYVAGLSAGAAMAVILGQTYPDVFAGVGAHSGLPFAAATDMTGAFAAMQGRATAVVNGRARAGGSHMQGAGTVPTIVFHGDADRTVNLSNGHAIVEDILERQRSGAALRLERVQSEAAGRSYTRDTHIDAAGKSLVEFWRLHGAGHTWSGGDPAGSHVDAGGPDASAEMLRFFLQHAKPETR